MIKLFIWEFRFIESALFHCLPAAIDRSFPWRTNRIKSIASSTHLKQYAAIEQNCDTNSCRVFQDRKNVQPNAERVDTVRLFSAFRLLSQFSSLHKIFSFFLHFCWHWESYLWRMFKVFRWRFHCLHPFLIYDCQFISIVYTFGQFEIHKNCKWDKHGVAMRTGEFQPIRHVCWKNENKFKRKNCEWRNWVQSARGISHAICVETNWLRSAWFLHFAHHFTHTSTGC